MKKLILLTFAFLLFTCSFAQQGAIQLPATGQTTSYYPGDDGDLQNGVAWPEDRFTNHSDGTATDKLTGLMWATEGNILANRDSDFDQDYDVGDGSVNWTTALDYVTKLNNENYLGYNDWRLPNIMELMSLLDLGRPDTALTKNHPFVNIQQSYWSSTSGDDKGIAYAIVMFEWEIHSNSKYWPGQVLWYNKILPEAYADKRKVYVLPVRGELGNGLIELPRTFQETSLYPDDDKDLAMGVPWPTPRFINHNDSTITDRLTGLMWTQNADPLDLYLYWNVELTWFQALQYIDTLNSRNYCGYNNWRLPNRNELLSLRDFGEDYLGTHLPTNHPFSGARSYFTSTTSASSTDKAHEVHFTIMDVTNEILKEDYSFIRIWPVRNDNAPLPSGSIQGKILINGDPLKNVKLNIEGPVNATVKSGDNGKYSFDHMPPGNYTVTPEKIYYEFNPATATINISDQTVIQDFTTTMTASHGWQNISTHLKESFTVNDIHFIGQEGWLAGARDKVYYTDDGGETFITQPLPDNAGIVNSVFMKNTEKGYIVTNNGKILTTNNGGEDWILLYETSALFLAQVQCPPNSETCFTCGSAGTIYRFTDNTIDDISPDPIYSDCASIIFPEDENEGKFCAETIIRRWYNNTWVNLQLYDNGPFYNSIFFTDNENGWAVAGPASHGGESYIIHTEDGISWIFQSSGIHEANYQDAYFISNQMGWVVGDDKILKTNNGGDEWILDAPGFTDGMTLVSVFFTSQNEGYAGGNNVLLKFGPLVSGISEQQPLKKPDIRIFPNPASSVINLQSTIFSRKLLGQQSTIVKIYDLNGRKLIEKHIPIGHETMQVDVSGLLNGLYFVRIQFENQTEIKKLIIQK